MGIRSSLGETIEANFLLDTSSGLVAGLRSGPKGMESLTLSLVLSTLKNVLVSWDHHPIPRVYRTYYIPISLKNDTSNIQPPATYAFPGFQGLSPTR